MEGGWTPPGGAGAKSWSPRSVSVENAEENEDRWPARWDIGPSVGEVRQRWAGVGGRLGQCIEEGKGRLAEHISSLGRRSPRLQSDGQVRNIWESRFWQPWLRVGGLIEESINKRRLEISYHLVQMVRRASRQANQRIHLHLLASLSLSSSDTSGQWEPKPLFNLAMNTEQVAKRLDGVPVYTVSNSANEFVLISDLSSSKSLGIFCFREEDAVALLAQVRDREPSLGRGAKVVAVSLDKVYQLNTEGIAFRFLPDPQQVKNALEARAKAGDLGRAFDGVPVFQSGNLILRSNNRRFCPIFFCKEDLENALGRAFKQQQRVNPALRVNTDVQVGSFEDVLKRMESNEEDTGWGDIVFIPPGMDAMNHLGKSQATVIA